LKGKPAAWLGVAAISMRPATRAAINVFMVIPLFSSHPREISSRGWFVHPMDDRYQQAAVPPLKRRLAAIQDCRD
jgi:hypothetical protein